MSEQAAATAKGSIPRRRRRWRRWAGALAALLAVVLVLGYAGATYAVYDTLSVAPRACHPGDVGHTPDNYAADPSWGAGLAAPYQMPVPQEVVFHSRDASIANAKLAGWWIPATGGSAATAPAVVVVHGIQSCRREASILMAAGMLHKHGYSVFLMDIRDHGDSQGDDGRFAGGSNEYLDVLGAWDWVRAQGVPANRIGLLGFSFGSALVLIAGGQEPAVRAVWADSAWTDTGYAIGRFLRDKGYPELLAPGAIVWGRVAGIEFTKFNPLTEVTHYQGRYLAFVHGVDDPVLPAAMAITLHDAAVAAGAHVTDTWEVPNAKHTEAIYRDPSGYESRLVTFFGGALGQPGA